jgi:predicted nucleic acid-binding protein
MALSVTIIFTPPEEESHKSESRIRDVKDRPILRAAIANRVNIIITGDKDFLESGLTQPKMMTASEFLQAQK